MCNAILKFGSVVGAAGMFALVAFTPSIAAPISSGAIALKSAIANDIVHVRGGYRYGGYGYRGYGYRGYGYRGYGYGFGTGLALGAIAASPYYYDPYYYAPPPAVVYGPPPGPVYVQPIPEPNGPVRQCWVPTDKDRGFGYYRPC